jgi:hypothetical protein
VNDVAIVFVQRLDGGHELANQAQGGVDVEREVVFDGGGEQIGDPAARHGVGNDRDGSAAQTFDAA